MLTVHWVVYEVGCQELKMPNNRHCATVTRALQFRLFCRTLAPEVVRMWLPCILNTRHACVRGFTHTVDCVTTKYHIAQPLTEHCWCRNISKKSMLWSSLVIYIYRYNRVFFTYFSQRFNRFTLVVTLDSTGATAFKKPDQPGLLATFFALVGKQTR